MYADAGYAVVLPNPRGSAGYGLEHGRTILGRLGTVDADDVLALLDAALDRPDCDSGRVGVMGGSYGGFMTSWLASKAPGRFTAAISERAVNAWDSFAGSSDIGFFFAQAYVGADRDSQWSASPLAYADEIQLPLLIIHSEQDWRCPLEQGSATVRRAEEAAARGGDVALPRRRPRTVPIWPAPPSAAALPGDLVLVAALPTGVSVTRPTAGSRRTFRSQQKWRTS